MKQSSRKLTGIGLTLFGIGLTIIGLSYAWTLIYGIPLTVIGIIIYYNKNEDKIEQIKKVK
jgi:hypothetical protein